MGQREDGAVGKLEQREEDGAVGRWSRGKME